MLITGPSGVGKSYLAQALGITRAATASACSTCACRRCSRSSSRRAPRAPTSACSSAWRKLSLLVIDDFGLATLNEVEKQDLLEAIEERYGIGATLVTSQLPVGDWHEYLGGGRIADAILDRLIHNAHRIELASKESMRKERPRLEPWRTL